LEKKSPKTSKIDEISPNLVTLMGIPKNIWLYLFTILNIFFKRTLNQATKMQEKKPLTNWHQVICQLA